MILLLEKQRSELLQAAAPSQELVAGVRRDVADGLLAGGGEGLDALVDAVAFHTAAAVVRAASKACM